MCYNNSFQEHLKIHNKPKLIFYRLFSSDSSLITGSSQTKAKSKKGSSSKALVRRKPIPIPMKSVIVGQILLCKMRGWSEWPCVVTDIKENLIQVTFFGDKTTHHTNIAHLFDFKESREIIRCNLQRLKSPLYKKSIREAELALGISPELSVLSHIV